MTKKIITVILCIGIFILGIISLVSLIVLIKAYLIKDIEILSISSTVFISTIGSLLTIAALYLTIYVYDREYKDSESRRESDKKQKKNSIENTIKMIEIQFYKHLVTTSTTANNLHTSKEKTKNLKFTLKFSIENLANLTEVKFNYITIYMPHESEGIKIRIENNKDFKKIQSINNIEFIYQEIVTVAKSDYRYFYNKVMSNNNVTIRVETKFCLKTIDEIYVECKQKRFFKNYNINEQYECINFY